MSAASIPPDIMGHYPVRGNEHLGGEAEPAHRRIDDQRQTLTIASASSMIILPLPGRQHS